MPSSIPVPPIRYPESAKEGRASVYLSYVVEDIEYANLLRLQLDRRAPVAFTEWWLRVPFESRAARHARTAIRERIAQVDSLICLVGMTTHENKWIDWELLQGALMFKRLLAIRLPLGATLEVPRTIRLLDIPVIDWDIGGVRRFLLWRPAAGAS